MEWITNVKTLRDSIPNIVHFNETLRHSGANVFFIMGLKSRIYTQEQFKTVFFQIPDENVIWLDAGHWVHFEKPIETIKLVSEILSKID